MKIRFYGKLAESIGREIDLDPPAERRTVAELRLLLAQRYPFAQADLTGSVSRACVGDSIVDEQFVVDGAGEIEFLPPLSGG